MDAFLAVGDAGEAHPVHGGPHQVPAGSIVAHVQLREPTLGVLPQCDSQTEVLAQYTIQERRLLAICRLYCFGADLGMFLLSVSGCYAATDFEMNVCDVFLTYYRDFKVYGFSKCLRF